MGKVYDDWQRLVEAVVRKEKDRQLCLQESRTPSESSSSRSSYQLDDGHSCEEALPLLHLQQPLFRLNSPSAQMSIVTLQEYLIRILNEVNQCFEPPTREASLQRKCFTNDNMEEHVNDFLHPDKIAQIKSIADTMFASRHEQEFCQAFIGFSRAAFAVYLTQLGVQELRSDEVHKMEKCLDICIKKWIFAIRNFIGCHLGCAKDAFDQILGEYGHINSTSFIESSQPSVTSLLNFGHAIAIETYKRQEWLFPVVGMCEVSVSVIPDIDVLFSGEIGSIIHAKFYDFLIRIKDSTKGILKEFGNYIGSTNMHHPYPRASIPSFTKYVVNSILFLERYEDTLNLLLEEVTTETMDRGPIVDEGRNISNPLADYVQSLASVFEAKLDHESNLYEDISCKHIFMMNNIHYLIEKIMNSKLCCYFGDEWIINHVGKFREHAMCYQRFTWSRVVSMLRYDDLWRVSKATLKSRCRAFTTAFEEVYERQTRLYVPHVQLREELRLLAFQIVIRKYQCFCRALLSFNGDKYIVYTANDLETYIMDLLEGSSKSLNHYRRRRSIRLYP